MSGFLSEYEGTERIELGRGYWADVKKCLSRGEMAHMEAAMGGRQQVDVTKGRQYAQLDTGAGRTELVVRSLVAWNLDDADGTVWSLDPGKPPFSPGCERRQSVARLPGPVFDRIWKRCDDLNGPVKDPSAKATFPGEDVGGDPDGDTGTADPASVPDRAGDVAAAGPDAGNVAVAAAP
jgi:hypothetical protein